MRKHSAASSRAVSGVRFRAGMEWLITHKYIGTSRHFDHKSSSTTRDFPKSQFRRLHAMVTTPWKPWLSQVFRPSCGFRWSSQPALRAHTMGVIPEERQFRQHSGHGFPSAHKRSVRTKLGWHARDRMEGIGGLRLENSRAKNRRTHQFALSPPPLKQNVTDHPAFPVEYQNLQVQLCLAYSDC